MKGWRLIKRKLRLRLPGLASLYTDVAILIGTARSANLIREVALVAQGAESVNQAGNDRVAVINSVRTYIDLQLCVELIFALKLRERGYRVHILYDDGVLVHHDTLTKIDHKPFRAAGRLRMKLSLNILRRLPLIGQMLTSYSSFLSSAEARRIAKELQDNDTTDIEPYVEASLVRFYLSVPDRRILSSEPDYKRARQMFVDNSRISQAVASKVVEKLNPSLLLTSHGIYSVWGSFMRKTMDSGVRAVCWGGNGYATDKIDLAVNDVAANKADGGFFEQLAVTALHDQVFMTRINNVIGEMLDSRMAGTASDIARLGMSSNDESHPILKRIKQAKQAGKEIFALFPNVMWDNATTFKEWNRVFESPVEWLIETVKYFAEANDKLLVIRAHPAEHLWMAVRKGVRDLLTFYLGEEILSHENVIFISPDEKFSSYRLFEHLNGGTVYNGTIGPELIQAGIPLILGARAAYSDKGFTFDPKNRQEYFNAFNRTGEILAFQEEHTDRAVLFLYEYFFLHGVKMRFMDNQVGFVPRYNEEPSVIWTDDSLEHAAATIVGEREYFQVMPDELVPSERAAL